MTTQPTAAATSRRVGAFLSSAATSGGCNTYSKTAVGTSVVATTEASEATT